MFVDPGYYTVVYFHKECECIRMTLQNIPAYNIDEATVNSRRLVNDCLKPEGWMMMQCFKQTGEIK